RMQYGCRGNNLCRRAAPALRAESAESAPGKVLSGLRALALFRLPPGREGSAMHIGRAGPQGLKPGLLGAQVVVHFPAGAKLIRLAGCAEGVDTRATHQVTEAGEGGERLESAAGRAIPARCDHGNARDLVAVAPGRGKNPLLFPRPVCGRTRQSAF